MFCNDCVDKLLNKPPYGQQNQANGTTCLGKWLQWDHTWLLRLECEKILLESDLPQIDLCHKFHSKKAALKVRAMNFSGREVAELATKLR